MILNNLGAILLKQKELKPTFKIFIKQFQEELEFIEQIIENDAEQLKNQSTCCYFLTKRLVCFRKEEVNRFEMFNPVFYHVFNQMTCLERQNYFLELLSYIDEVNQIHRNFDSSKVLLEHMNINNYRAKMQSKLIETLINKDVMKLLETDQIKRTLDLKVNIYGEQRRKVGRFLDWKFELIEKIKGVETKIVMDLRNYIILEYCKEEQGIVLHAIYETIKPLSIQLKFNEKNDTDLLFEKYYSIFTEMIRIGKIEKLVHSIELSKLFDNQDLGKQQNERSNLMKTFVKQEEQFSDHENNFSNSDDIFKASVASKRIKVKKLESLRVQHYEDLKKKLIDTLNFLADKRENENKKIQEFLKRQPISQPKTKSDAVLRVLRSTEASVPRKVPPAQLTCDQIQKEVAHFFIDIQGDNECLSIMNRNKQTLKQKKSQDKNDSFYADSKHNLSWQSVEFNLIFNQNKQKPKIDYKRNLYKRLYRDDYKFSSVQSLMDMIKLELNGDVYAFPEEKIAKESKGLLGDKLHKFRIAWIEKLKKTVRMSTKKSSPTFVKICIPFAIQLKALVHALINVQAYPRWHPNIKSTKIEGAITSQNMLIFKMDVASALTGQQQSLLMIMHLFKFENKHYIVMKLVQDLSRKQKKGKGLLDLFSFSKTPSSYFTLTFLMIRAYNISKNGFCEMAITVDHQPTGKTSAELARKEAISLFLNFIFIKDYWKLSNQQKQFNQNLLSLDWVIEKSSFTSQSEVREQKQIVIDEFEQANLDHNLSLISQQNRQSVHSSSELIHSSQFYDI